MTLNDWLSARAEITNSEFAERIGVSRQALWRYRSGERMPERAVMQKIMEETGGAVTPNDFFASIAAAE